MTDSKESSSEPQPAMGPGTTVPLKPTSSRRTEVGAAALTILFYALLVDAAIETFLSGSPVRLLVAATIAAYMVLTVCTWRFGASFRNRFEWSARATASFFVLLGLFAATAWLRGGLTDGVVILRQPTGVIFSVVSAAGVAFAGLTLGRSRFLPWWTRAAVGLLALYGVAAFAVGVIDGTPYYRLLRGESLWRWLPYWLQGASVGALIAVPLAVVSQIVEALKQVRAVEGKRWRLQQSVALGLTTVMAASGFTQNAGPGLAGRSNIARAVTRSSLADEGAQRPGARSPEEAARALEELRPLGKALALLKTRLDARSFDPAELGRSLGGDPAASFAYVRDQVRFEPYRGLLRGARGTLVSGAGNALDRAVLLADLLRAEKKNQVRIVHGELADADAERLLAESATRLVEAPRVDAEALDAELVKFAGEAGLDAGAVMAFRHKFDERRATLDKTIEDRTAEDLAILRAELARAGVSLGGRSAPAKEELVRRLRDHFWVQVRSAGTESVWQDLDPSFRDALPGTVRGTATSQFTPDQVPERYRHTLRVKLALERVFDGKREEVPLLDKSLPTAACMGETAVLVVLPHVKDEEKLLRTAMGTEVAKLALLRETSVFQPALVFAGEQTGGHPFDLDGQVYDVPSPGVLQFGQAGSRVRDLLAGGLRGDRNAPKQGTTLSLRLDLVLEGPDGQARTFARTIFDRLPAENRAAGRWEVPDAHDEDARLGIKVGLIREVALGVTPGTISRAFAEATVLSRVRAFLDHHVAALTARAGGRKLDARRYIEDWPRGLRADLLAYETLRQARMHVDASRGALAAYYPSPSVAAYVVANRPAAKGTPGRGTMAYDIVDNPVEYLPLTGRGAGVTSPGELTLRQGVIDTEVECLLVSHGGGAHSGAGDVLRAAKAAGIAMAVLTPKNPVEVDGLDLSPAVRGRIRAELAAGRIVVVPRRAVELDGRPTVAWWRVDLPTGRTLGIAEDGTGGDAVETALLILHFGVALVGFEICVLLGEGFGSCFVSAGVGLVAYELLGPGLEGIAIVLLAYAIEVLLSYGFHRLNDWWDETIKEPQGHGPWRPVE